MRPLFVVVRLKIRQLVFQVPDVPEHSVIQKLRANGPDQPLDERVRAGRVGNGFDLVNLQDAKIHPPAVIWDSGSLSELSWCGITQCGDGCVEHSTQC